MGPIMMNLQVFQTSSFIVIFHKKAPFSFPSAILTHTLIKWRVFTQCTQRRGVEPSNAWIIDVEDAWNQEKSRTSGSSILETQRMGYKDDYSLFCYY